MIPQLEKATALRAVPLFAALDAEELLALAGLSEDLDVASGSKVFAENEPGDALYVVVRGAVKVQRGDHVLLVGFGAGLCWGGQILRL